MNNENKLRLWRVLWVHLNGYQAPTQVVEAKTRKEVIEFAKEQRLADFPKSWYFLIEDSKKVQKHGKWYDNQ
jgi:hypothetical protein